MSKLGMTKDEMNEHIQHYVDMILGDPEFYMDTESYCDLDVYSLAKEMVEDNFDCVFKRPLFTKVLSPKEQEEKIMRERFYRGKLKEAPGDICLLLTDKEYDEVIKSLEECNEDGYGFMFVRDAILRDYPQLRLDHFDHIEFDETRSYDEVYFDYESEGLHEVYFNISYSDWYEADRDYENKLDEKIAEKIASLKRNRGVPARLRHKILKRDNYRCVLCGWSAEDGVKLHIDHKIPVSKGGLTVEENLRTLCEACNLGKSNDID